jgi:hypothetical protein
MRKPAWRASFQVERLEPREVPSGLVPVLTTKAVSATVSAIGDALATVSNTHSTSRLESALDRLAHRLPYGSQQLLPLWSSDVARYTPGIPGSGRVLQGQLISDLNQYVRVGAATGAFRVTGPGAGRFYGSPAPGTNLGGISQVSVTLPNGVTVNPNPVIPSYNTVPYTLNYNYGYTQGSVVFTISTTSASGGTFTLNASSQNRINWSPGPNLTGYTFTVLSQGTTARNVSFAPGASDQSGLFRSIVYSGPAGRPNQITMSQPTQTGYYVYFQPIVSFTTASAGNVVIQETPSSS